MSLEKGSRVLITYKGRELEGRVILASQNQQSLMLAFDGMLGGYVGSMPVLLAPGDDCYRDLIEHDPVEVREL